MNKAQLENDIKEMEARLASMKAELAKPVKSKVFVPETGKDYWWVDSVRGTRCNTWRNDDTDKTLLAFGNVYETEALAQKASAKQFATVRVLNKLRELEGDWEADWKDYSQTKYAVSYGHFNKDFALTAWSINQYSPKEWHSTKEACQFVIDNMQDYLKLMYGVE